MPQHDRARLPEPIASGTLAKRPLSHLLVYADARRLTGSFLLDHAPAHDPDATESTTRQSVYVYVHEGELARVATTVPVVYLGHVLYEAGVLTGAELSASLAEVAVTKALHGQALLRRRIVSATDLASALRSQRQRKLAHAFSIPPEAKFSFYPGVDLVGERPCDVPPESSLPHVWRGINAHPSWDHVSATLNTVAGRPLRVVGSVDALGLGEREREAALALTQTPGTVRMLAARAGVDTKVAELLAYFLVITRRAEITERVSVSVPPLDAHPPRVTTHPPPAVGSGEYARKISFTMRAVSPDTHGLRIPSPIPGRLFPTGPLPPSSAGPSSHPRARTSPEPIVRGKASREAEQALEKAEMRFVLGERDVALRHLQEALDLAGDWPDASAFQVHVDAAAVRDGEDAKLRALLRRIDATLDADALCRRGRYYRALIRSRLGDHEGAIRDLRVAVTHDPDDLDAQRVLASYARKVKAGTLVVRSMSPFAGIPAAKAPVPPRPETRTRPAAEAAPSRRPSTRPARPTSRPTSRPASRPSSPPPSSPPSSRAGKRPSSRPTRPPKSR